MSSPFHMMQASDRVLSTLEKDGSRRWMWPKLSMGRFWHSRRAVAYALIALFTLVPFLRIGGKPVLLLDVAHRRFTVLGQTFLPTDTIVLAVFVLTALLSIFFVTALLGRVWCGWACPQTVYMEFVFRPIERLFTGRSGRGGKPGDVAAWRKVLMYVTYVAICLHLANTFLSYFVAPAQLNQWITSSPAKHPAGFMIVMAVAGMMLFNFAFFREQTCIIACPYGRLQSVLLDRQSLIISYDSKRGEPRGKKTRGSVANRELPVASGKKTSLPVLSGSVADLLATRDAQLATPPGDCVDCEMCVQVCPTGIDIRQGLQVECIACAQCIDACDTVMDKVARARGLIRYSSQAAMAGEKTRLIRPRVIVYSGIVAVLGSLLTMLLTHQSLADVTILRNPGRPFAMTNDGLVENTLRVKITNRTEDSQRYRLAVVGRPEIQIYLSHETVDVPPGDSVTEPIRVLTPRTSFEGGRLDVHLQVATEATGEAATQVSREMRLLGPNVTPQTIPVGGSK